MTDLEKAAQAVLVRWDSPAWQRSPAGRSTAALMADLRRALAAHREQAEPAVWDPQCPLCGGSRQAALAKQAEPVVDAVLAEREACANEIRGYFAAAAFDSRSLGLDVVRVTVKDVDDLARSICKKPLQVRTVKECLTTEIAALAEPRVEPKPYCYVYEYYTYSGLIREFQPRLHNGRPPDCTVPVYTHPPQQAEPVSAPPKSFRVGYMTGWDDGQRELREKQQADPVQAEPAVEPEPMVDFESWWVEGGVGGPDPIGPLSKETAEWIWKSAIAIYKQQAEPVVEPVALAHKDILRMAREAGWPASVLHPHGPGVDTSGYLLVSALERFAALARADVVASAKNLEQQAEPVAWVADSGNPSF
jgi:hypothetical protein